MSDEGVVRIWGRDGELVREHPLSLVPRRRDGSPDGWERGAFVEFGTIPLYDDAGEPAGVRGVEVEPEAVVRWAFRDALLNLEPGVPFEIRRGVPTNYGCTHGIGWFSQPGMPAEVVEAKDARGEYDAVGGFFLIARGVA